MTRKIFMILILLITFSVITSAAMDPELKECIQRGYDKETAPNLEPICVFPDNSNCTINDFNSGVCGEEFMTENYCIEEGLPVWDRNKCCEGTEAYARPNTDGQATCEQVSIYQKISDWLLYNLIFIVLILIVLIIVIVWIIKKKK